MSLSWAGVKTSYLILKSDWSPGAGGPNPLDPPGSAPAGGPAKIRNPHISVCIYTVTVRSQVQVPMSSVELS